MSRRHEMSIAVWNRPCRNLCFRALPSSSSHHKTTLQLTCAVHRVVLLQPDARHHSRFLLTSGRSARRAATRLRSAFHEWKGCISRSLKVDTVAFKGFRAQKSFLLIDVEIHGGGVDRQLTAAAPSPPHGEEHRTGGTTRLLKTTRYLSRLSFLNVPAVHLLLFI